MWERVPILFVLVLIYSLDAFKILIVSPMPGKSHAILGDGLVRHLSQAGHEITYITAIVPAKSRSNVQVLDVSANFELMKNQKMLSIGEVMDTGINLPDLINMINILSNVTRMTVENSDVQQLMNDKHQQFDVIIAEWMFSELYCGLQAVFECPFIWLSSLPPHAAILRLIDEFPSPAYSADIQSSSIPPFTFKQRLVELVYQVFSVLNDKFLMGPKDENYYEKIIAPIVKKKGSPVPSFEELKYNASLILGNSHVSLDAYTRLPESYKHIGGYHIEEKVKPLPDNLKKLIESANHGLIYFNMGSNLKSKTLPDDLKYSLLKMFSGLKETVLWKFEEEFPNRPSNVHIVEWAPQQSILAHPNVRVFITHGGLLSITESVHFGVPIIGIPVFGDQFANVDRAVKKGFAKRVDLSYTMADELKEAINDILSDERYRRNAKDLSAIYHDRAVSPGKELVHWVEHVIKTKGAPHLRSPALMITWYQKYYLDLGITLLFIGFGMKYCIIWLISRFQSRIYNKKKVY